MFEDITEEELQEKIKLLVGKVDSIGVHGISINPDEKGTPKERKDSILSEGLRMSKQHRGLTGTIHFLDSENFSEDMFDLAYQTEDENDHNCYRIICAIPEVVEDVNGEKHYLGKYDKVSTLDKDNFKVQMFPTHNIELLPPELIVGYLSCNMDTYKRTFVMNPKFINIKEEPEQRAFWTEFIKKLPTEPLVLNEQNYRTYSMIRDMHQQRNIPHFPNEHYILSFLKAYESEKQPEK